jgi:hypothetical protein
MLYQDEPAAHPDGVVGQELHPGSYLLEQCEIGADDAPAGSTRCGNVYAKKESWEEA